MEDQAPTTPGSSTKFLRPMNRVPPKMLPARVLHQIVPATGRTRKTRKQARKGPRNTHPVSSRRRLALRDRLRCSAGESRNRPAAVRVMNSRAALPSRQGVLRRPFPSQSGFVLHDLFDIGNRLLGGFLAGVAVLDLRLGELLDGRPLGEILEADRVFLEQRQRFGELGRAAFAVS